MLEDTNSLDGAHMTCKVYVQLCIKKDAQVKDNSVDADQTPICSRVDTFQTPICPSVDAVRTPIRITV